MKFFLALFVLATAARGEAPNAIPSGNSKADLAELTERLVRLEKLLNANLLEKAKRQNIGLNGLNIVELEQGLDKRMRAKTALRASDAQQDITLDTLEAYLRQLDDRITALENSTDAVMAKFTKLESSTKCEIRMQSSDLLKATYSGTPGASSEWSTTHTKDKAFKPESDKPWASSSLPATVWYKFNYQFKLAKISFTSRAESTNWDQVPKTFEVVGSYDCSKWYVLKSVSNAKFTAEGQTKAWEIPCEKQKSYKCYGVKASASSGQKTLVALANTKMYHLPEQ